MNQHAAALETGHLSLPLMQESLSVFIAIDHINKIFYIDQKKSGAPLLVTWLDRAERQCGFSKIFSIKYVGIEEIAAQHAKGGLMSIGQKTDDMHNQNKAIEIISKAAKIGAADIHFLVRTNFTEIQLRTKGDLRVLTRNLSHSDGHAIIRAMYQGLAAVKTTYLPQEFQNTQLSGQEISKNGLTSARLIRGPCYPEDEGNAFCILRLQYTPHHKTSKGDPLEVPRRPEGHLNLADRGYTAQQVERLKLLARMPSGINVFSGPVGSGKTTALHELLTHTAREFPGKRIITIEDPVEIPIPSAIQISIINATTEAETGAKFSECLRASLRMDPNILYPGELRGKESAAVAIEAAQTGRLVFSTIHTNDAYEFIDRLEFMDSRRFARGVICNHKLIRGLVAQRLIPKLCPQCSVLLSTRHTEIPRETILALKTYGGLSRVRIKGPGCPTCHNDGTGAIGRLAVAEVVATDADLMYDFIHHGTAVARRNHRAKPDSDKSLLENAIIKCLNGLCDPRDVESYVDIITPKGAE